MQTRLLLAVAATLSAGIFLPGSAQAHGTLSKPMSRIYACY